MSGKYRILSCLGKGNSSEVFLAEHRKLKAYRAVKCISKSAHPMQPQLLLEADILKNLKHPGIPTIYDVEEDDKSYYIIEEYIQGQSLEAFVLRQDCISIDTVIHMALQICDVIKYLHGQPEPIIHQDLKPEHILLCGNRIVLIDFGISSFITSSGNTFQYFGTEGFAPPEKYQGISCDVRADIYGIGKVLEFMTKKAAGQSDKKSQLLKPLIQKAAANSREERYASIEELISALSNVLENGYQNFQQKKNKHLLKKIAVAGTQERVGTTHFAIALASFCNQYYSPCIYRECRQSDCIRLLANEEGSYIGKDGAVMRGKFRGMPYYGEGIAQWDSDECLYIQDYGIQLEDVLEGGNRLIVVMGSRPWECERSRSLLEKISLRENLVLVCNYGNSVQAKRMARMYHHRVYCFPLDEDPFRMTREKRKWFQKLLLQEGW